MNTRQRKYIAKHTRFTDLKYRSNKSIMPHRLDGSIRERAALNYLLKDRGGDSFINTIYTVLCMKKDFFNSRFTTDIEKEWGKKLLENKELVDRVIDTIFQWFGTNVGWAELQRFADIMKEWPNEASGKLKEAIRKNRLEKL